MTSVETHQSNDRDTEIDFIYLIRKFWDRKIFIGKLASIGILAGFFVAILIPNQFTASSTMIPQITDTKSKLAGLSGLSSVAAMAGINLGTTSGSELSPRTYSSIITSVPFQLELMKTMLNFDQLENPITFYDYYTQVKSENKIIKYSIGLPSLIYKSIIGEKKNKFKSPQSNPLYQLTEDQIEVQRIITDKVSVSVNETDGSVTLSCSLPEAYASAQLALKAQELLQSYITKFKVEKAKADEEFILQRYNEAKLNYLSAQQKLALFRDRNRNTSTATAKSEEELLTSENSLLSGVYSELAKKLEQSKIEVKEETPVFTIIKPVSVPTKKSQPNRPLILGIFCFVGLLTGIVIVLGEDYLLQLKAKWKVRVQ